MISMKGRYNSANIFIDEIDDSTREQIQGFLNHPAFGGTYIAIMPDCHAGAGAVVGFTMKMNDYIIPSIIGVDIGCGMLLARFPVQCFSFEALDNFIKKNIPSGFSINPSYNMPKENEGRIRQVCTMIGIDPEKALKAVGSLGGGNHFIEAGYDSQGNTCVTIHSGSRNFGLKVANFYQQKAKEGLERYFIRDQYKALEFMPIDTPDALDYLFCLGAAQEFAFLNRRTMMERIAGFFGVDPIEKIESVHNFIGSDDIIRKGATPAREDEQVIIPFNMRDGLAICRGKGSAKYNFSAPHGAGRIMSRSQARKELSVVTFREQMEGVYTTTANIETIDEAPRAYKEKEIILQNISETVEVVEFIKPVYNFKAGKE